MKIGECANHSFQKSSLFSDYSQRIAVEFLREYFDNLNGKNVFILTHIIFLQMFLIVLKLLSFHVFSLVFQVFCSMPYLLCIFYCIFYSVLFGFYVINEPPSSFLNQASFNCRSKREAMQKSECQEGVQLRSRVTGTEHCFLSEEVIFINDTSHSIV